MSDEKKESRINLEHLPQDEQELNVAEQKQVQGGATRAVGGGIRSGGTSDPPPPISGI